MKAIHHSVYSIHSFISQLRKNGMVSSSVLHALIFRLTGLALIFLMQVLMARLMGPSDFGHYTVIITILNMLLVVSLFGFDSSALRFLPVFIAKKEFNSAKTFVRFSHRVTVIVASACSIGVFAYLVTHSNKLPISFSEGMFWGLLLLPMLAILYHSAAVLRSLHKVKTSLFPVYFLFPVLMAGGCYLYFHLNKKLSVDAGMMINLICTAVVCLFAYRKSRKSLTGAGDSEGFTQIQSKWIGVSGVLFITTALDLLLRQSDVLLVSHYLCNTEAGYYSVAARLATLASLGLSVTDYVVMPKIASLFQSRQLIKLQELVRNSSTQMLSITIPVVIVLFAGGKWILGMFGEQFTQAYLPLIILLCGQLINAMTGMVGGLMTMTGHQRIFLLFYFFAFVLQILLNTVLINKLGITGAAIGSSLSMIVLNVMAYKFVKHRLHIRSSWF